MDAFGEATSEWQVVHSGPLGSYLLSRGYLVDLYVTVFTLDVINKMGACIMLCPFLLVATMAGHRLRMNRPPGFHASIDVRDIIMATVANWLRERIGQLPLTDFWYGSRHSGIVDTLITIFGALMINLSPFLAFEKLGYPCRFRSVFF
jgi:hypothetical protein